MKKLIALMLIMALCLAPAALAENYAPLQLDAKQNHAMNLFLSNFTEQDLSYINAWADSSVLVDFAHDYLWRNAYESYEYGDYSGDNNCRVSDDRIQDIVKKFFYEEPEVDLSQTRFDYDGEYYYHCETGGWMNGGFAHVMSACPVGGNQYLVSFAVFGDGENWDNDVMDAGIEELIAAYGGPSEFGSALIYAGNLSDRDTYRMISFRGM